MRAPQIFTANLCKSASNAATGGGITTGGGFGRIRSQKAVTAWQHAHVEAYMSSAEGKAAVEGYFKTCGQNCYDEDESS